MPRLTMVPVEAAWKCFWCISFERSAARMSAVDVSAGFAVLELTGPMAPAVLAHGCAIDLHPRVLGPGRAARTMLAKAQVRARPDRRRGNWQPTVPPDLGAVFLRPVSDRLAARCRDRVLGVTETILDRRRRLAG